MDLQNELLNAVKSNSLKDTTPIQGSFFRQVKNRKFLTLKQKKQAMKKVEF